MLSKDIPDRYLPIELGPGRAVFDDGVYQAVSKVGQQFLGRSNFNYQFTLVANPSTSQDGEDVVHNTGSFVTVRNLRVRGETHSGLSTNAAVLNTIGVYCTTYLALSLEYPQLTIGTVPVDTLDTYAASGPYIPYEATYGEDEDHFELYVPGPIKLYRDSELRLLMNLQSLSNPGEGITINGQGLVRFSYSYCVKF